MCEEWKNFQTFSSWYLFNYDETSILSRLNTDPIESIQYNPTTCAGKRGTSRSIKPRLVDAGSYQTRKVTLT